MLSHFISSFSLDSQHPVIYIRMTFPDFSSVFNTVLPDMLVLKLHNLRSSASLCSWIRVELLELPHQQAPGGEDRKVHICSADPQHWYAASLCAQPVLTHQCSAIHFTNMVVKFAEDTTMIGLIANNDENHYTDTDDLLSTFLG